MTCCTTCLEDKPAGEFYPRNRQCKGCVKEKQRRYKERRRGDYSSVSEKACNRCLLTLPASAFYQDKSSSNGLHVMCKACIKWSNLEKRYGITEEAYKDFLERQGGLCAICRGLMSPPHVDHCHSSGKVRGLLCSECNLGLGKFKDNPEFLSRATSYLLSHRTQI